MNGMKLPDAIEDALIEFSLFDSLECPHTQRTTAFALSLTRSILCSLALLAPWALFDIIFSPVSGGISLDWNEGVRELTLIVPASSDQPITWVARSYDAEHDQLVTTQSQTYDESTLLSCILWLKDTKHG